MRWLPRKKQLRFSRGAVLGSGFRVPGSGRARVPSDPGQHPAYVGGWIKALHDEPLETFRAAADAEKIQK